MLFDAGCCNPTGSVLRIRLDEGIEQHPGTLDVSVAEGASVSFEHDDVYDGASIPYLSLCLECNAVKIREVSFRIDGGRCAACDRTR